MPNQPKSDKPASSRFRTSNPRARRTGESVKDLLARAGTPVLTRLTDQAARQAAWRRWLEAHLPPQAASRLSGVVERDDTLVVFTESAAWSARVRYALAEIEDELRSAHPGIRRVTVRVLPRS
mgnify:CR=1 FL=1